MRILDLYAENIYSYKKIDVDLTKYAGGVTLILGRNLDQKTSNGSGKTSILKTLYFLYYGEDLQGVKKELVKNREISEGFYLKGSFEDRGNVFTVERFEDRKDKHRSGKGLNLFVNGKLFAEGSELGYTEVQKIIISKLRMSSRLFLSAVLSVQNDSKNFLLSNDTDKKELLSELLDLQAYAKAFDFVKKETTKIEEEIELKKIKIINIEETIKLLDEQVKDLIVKRDSFKIENKKNIENEENLLILEKNKKNDLQNQISNNYDLEKLKLEITSLKDENENSKSKIAIEPKIVETLLKISMEVEQNNLKIKELNESILKDSKEIYDLNLIVLDLSQAEKLAKNEENINLRKIEKENIEKELKNIEISLIKLNSEISVKKQKSIDLLEKIKELENSDVCPTCERVFDQTHKEHLVLKINEIKDQKNKVEKDLEKIQLEVFELESSRKTKQENLHDFDNIDNAQKEIEQEKIKFILEKQRFELKEEKKQGLLLSNQEKNELINKKKERNDFLKQKESPLLERQRELEPLKNSIKKNDETLAQLGSSLVQAEIEFNKNIQIKERIVESDKIISSISAKIIDLKNTSNPYGSMISDLDIKISGQLDRINKLKKDTKEELETLKYYNFWQVGFAPTGIRSFITDDVIELLNRKVQDNLNDLFDGAISIVFDPETKKKGVVSNKISTNCFLNGKEAPVQSLSDGEKRRAILATELALTEVAEARSGSKLNIRFLDEPMNGIDSHGQMPALRLFSRLAKDKDGFFVISHDESFQSMCPTTLFVVKKDSVSKIVSKEEFNRADYSADDMDEIPIKSTRNLDQLEGKSKKQLLAEKLKEIQNKKNEG